MATILIVIHNSELACEIAADLRREGHRALYCPSVRSPEFLSEFSGAALVVTDLVPAVLRLLPIGTSNLLEAGVPLLLLAARGHCQAFTAAIGPERGDSVPLDGDPRSIEAIRAAARRLLGVPALEPGPATARGRTAAVHPPHPRQTVAPGRRAGSGSEHLISDLAHDLRTPLIAIHDFARLMRDGVAGAVSEQQRRYVDIIERRCREASRMVDDLLDAAKIRSGRIRPHRQAVAIGEVIADVREGLEPALRHGDLGFAIELSEDLPRGFADRDMLGRILTNLMSNAVKFTPPRGTVAVRCERHSVSMVRVSVIDSGSGISPEEMRRIFRRFEQGSNRVRDGVGLGLAIVRHLVRLQGGRVTAESTPGQGSRFHFTLPLFIPIAILRRHLAPTRGAAADWSIWSILCPESRKYDAIHRLLTSCLPARDLVLPEDSRRRILLVTRAQHAALRIERLKRQIVALSVSVPTFEPLSPRDLKRWLDGSPDLQPRQGGRSDSLAG